jgi:hypothetical protein
MPDVAPVITVVFNAIPLSSLKGKLLIGKIEVFLYNLILKSLPVRGINIHITLYVKSFFKSLYLKTKLNIIVIKNAKSYVAALRHQKNILDLIEQFVVFFNENDTKGYLFTDSRMENSIQLTVGSEKFTIMSNIQEGGKIIFNVFLWIFDLSSLTRYSDRNIEQLTLIKDGVSLCFKDVQYNYENRDFNHLCDLNGQLPHVEVMEKFFEQVERYINQKNNPQEPQAY